MAKKPVSVTPRSLKNLRDRGYEPCVVEYFNYFARKRKDLYGFIDIVALHPGERGILGVQCTTASNLAAREKKAIALPAYWKWLQAGNVVEMHGWAKKGPKGKRKLWTPIIRRTSLADLLWK